MIKLLILVGVVLTFSVSYAQHNICYKDCSNKGTCLSNNNTCVCDPPNGGVSCEETGPDPNCPSTKSDTCSPFARCRNFAVGGPDVWQCQCYEGFIDNSIQKDGTSCLDIDECQASPCAREATCKNFPGWFNCTCSDGWQGDGYTCVDIDECATANPCGAGTNCTNVLPPQKFQCNCLPGFIRQTATTCIKNAAPAGTPVPVSDVPPPPDSGYIAKLKVTPVGLCWSKNPEGTFFYFDVNNHFFETVEINGNVENSVKINDGDYNVEYPNIISKFPIGQISALAVKGDANTNSVSYRVDGLEATFNKSSSNFEKQRCPAEIKLVFYADLSCSDSLEASIASSVESVINQKKPAGSSFTVTVKVSGCSAKRALGSVSVSIAGGSNPPADNEYSAMDVVFPALLDKSLIDAVGNTNGVSLSTSGSPGGVATDNLNPILGSPDPTNNPPPPSVTISGLNVSAITFAIILGSIIIGLIIICIMGVVVWRAKKKASEERV